MEEGASEERRRVATVRRREWLTVDGPLGLHDDEEAVNYARRFFLWGFCFLPWLWALNCIYFWPILRNDRGSSAFPAFDRLRPYVLKSAIGFVITTVFLVSWALTFAIGGERLFGPAWKDFVIYNLADKWGLTGYY